MFLLSKELLYRFGLSWGSFFRRTPSQLVSLRASAENLLDARATDDTANAFPDTL
jgi:hypothetical protein